jgi:hypothetical protein
MYQRHRRNHQVNAANRQSLSQHGAMKPAKLLGTPPIKIEHRHIGDQIVFNAIEQGLRR